MADMWSHTFELSLNDGGWSIRDPGEGAYSPNLGWVATVVSTAKRVVIQKTFALTTITQIRVLYDFTQGTSGFMQAVLQKDSNPPMVIADDGFPPSNGTNKVLSWSG